MILFRVPLALGLYATLNAVGLSKACGQWAAESRNSPARIAFRQMGKAWARLAFNEEFIITAPLEERIEPPTAQKSEATPVEILASVLAAVSSEGDAHPQVERDWTRPSERLSLPRKLLPKLWAKSPSR